MSGDLPPEVLEQLSCIPEDAPEDFTCVICNKLASNRFNWSPRDFERPPICRVCETISGYSWTGAARHYAKPTGGTFRDRREAMRINALAEALATAATRQEWSRKHGYS